VSIPEVGSRDRLIAFLRGALKKLNSLTVANYTFPESDGSENQVLTTDGAGTLTFENAGGGGGGISWDGSTANGVATYKDADEATVESNLTFDGSTLSVTGDIEASGDLTVSGGDIYGTTNGALRLKADTNMYFDCDNDGDGAGHFYWRNGANTIVAELDESGDLQLDGTLQVDGETIKAGPGPVSLTFTATDTAIGSDLTVTGDYLTTNGDIQASNGTVSAAGMQLRTVTSYIKDQSGTNRIVVQSGGHVGLLDSGGNAEFTVFDTYCAAAGDIHIANKLKFAGDTDNYIAMDSQQIDFYLKGLGLWMELDGNGIGMRGATPIAGLAVTGDIEASADATVNGVLTVGDGNLADGDSLLVLNSDRAWTFKQSGNGSTAGLLLQNTNGPNKNFGIQTNGETRFYNNSSVETAVLNNNTGDLQLDGDLTVSSAGSTIAQETWTAPTLEINWSNYGGDYVEAGYMKDSMGFVHIRGMLDCNGAGDHIFTLPVGYRPASRLIFVVLYYDNGTYRPGRLDIYGASDATYPGEVHILYPSTVASVDWVSIEGITFDTR